MNAERAEAVRWAAVGLRVFSRSAFEQCDHVRADRCPWCCLMWQSVEAAALEYDVANSIGRRWSAPSWLEAVAY